ncbi:MAG: hypothetical protein A3I07_03020 [Candidatus Doudnabacteria bacterium RIFCSPLOWO2_02_FULL_42_9]|uniref:Serine protease n=1 Tax=Candidatus Doudnabacteria bacterium RIFCSPHIGHO2_01_FULL_41_86 TaxID=1817821 RepID=A0A1F5N7Q0_9BACT|nr:MAG: hypothetical protein A2717_03170 [Candidatus Doudnabacteria bacterium RIFCSPHIGHO2_01_FULL_41_86]OGE75702.1 MAG: hypothetical protein A3K07_00520 [Candidatus Doudnabacteria bacterium RIFCSPHIGHO2_01_43_10]OGE85649.1 MAG: hypothetical protein A3E28_02500 [Candidatus Doudnabacteria bacterium RIFCSPHIGHO2_12_FULL_42_22]OGE87145.1 MAG: hypothetical protein A3C49_00135 [Candidatus Doudnabacteria bacterium RIFCSPHIGHO2_02_FULL_42_25]OGE91983.1 MAG: hypothetical protein A2895_00010 [Candidatus
MFSNNVPFKKDRILRVTINYTNNGWSTGSGFFINDKGHFLTCFHVAFGQGFSKLKNTSEYQQIIGLNEHEKLDKWFAQSVKSVIIEFPDKTTASLKLKKHNHKFDIVLLKLSDENFGKDIKYFDLDFNAEINYDDHVFFAGFPISPPYDNRETPFAINTGIVSSFPNTEVVGERYQHIQINSISLGGNSGAPLFRKYSNKVIGIINGNMNWGADNVAYVVDDKTGRTQKGSLRTPLSIAYATSLRMVYELTDLFK